MKKYNWGIIGNGWIAHHMPDALNAVNSEIYAAAGVNETTLKDLLKKNTFNMFIQNPDKMIADPNVDIVYIATPHTFHYDYIKKL
ncbi:gfo/Idh/MocA family oxidoreductase, partial [Bifidobacterium animalis subsp. lactis BB-12]